MMSKYDYGTITAHYARCVREKLKEWQRSFPVQEANGTTVLKKTPNKMIRNYSSEQMATGKAKTEKKG